MKRTVGAVLVACVLLAGKAAWAHRIDEYLQATMVSLNGHEVQASMRLIPGVLVASRVIGAIDSNRDGVFSDAEKRSYAERVLGDLRITMDGRRVLPELRSWEFPQPEQMRAGLGEIRIAYALAAPPGGPNRALVVANDHPEPFSVYLMNAVVPEDGGLRIVAQKRNESQSVYELDYEQTAVAKSPAEGLRAWLRGLPFGSLFRLGMRHIAEGTDHLLFLLVLLLPAPLRSYGGRWTGSAGARRSVLRILGIVTAFTVGHSLTLGLAAMNVVRVPERPIEVLIALSILVSAVHALRPLFPGREALVAAFFGLVHGLAFAATLERLGLSHWERVAGILAFNLGIETMQMLVVVAVLPSLLLLSRTAAYPAVRVGGAALAGVASLGWTVERVLDVATPVDRVVNALARHALPVAAALFVVSVACAYLAEGEAVPRLPRTNS